MKQIAIHVGLTWQVEKLDKSLTKIRCQVVLSVQKKSKSGNGSGEGWS